MGNLTKAPLGKQSAYISHYQPDLLFAVARSSKRDEIGVPTPLPFQGFDEWNAYELSWLDLKGKPQVMLAKFYLPCQSPYLIESKSFKLYLNSFNDSQFASAQEVSALLEKDLSQCAGMPVEVILVSLEDSESQTISRLHGECLDHLDVTCDTYTVNKNYLVCCADKIIRQTFFSHLLKSNCLVTGQPDWGSVTITYEGRQIDPAGLLKYIISFRRHNEFHEQCVERIFMDITGQCQPQKLTVSARYTRRGGLDINPLRTSEKPHKKNIRLIRQ